jgi:hypothetical protein
LEIKESVRFKKGRRETEYVNDEVRLAEKDKEGER